MIKKTLVSAFLLGVSVLAGTDSTQTSSSAEDPSRLSKVEKAISKIVAKAGINLSGEIRSQFLLSTVKGKAVADSLKTQEGVEYTSVDFDISARPSDVIQGRVIFRFQEDWRNLFSSFYSPVFSRWISLDGNVKNIFTYNVGDFKQKYSPLTLYSPDIDIPYEPEIFSRLRELAMSEEFLGDNERVLQGANMNFDAEIAPVFKELHVNLLGTRLRSAGVNTSEEGGAMVVNLLEVAPFDKYLIGANLNMVFIPDYMLGGTFMNIFDWKETYSGKDTATVKINNVNRKIRIFPDTMIQRQMVIAGRAGVGTAPFVDKKIFNSALTAEFAYSLDDSAYLLLDTVIITNNIRDTIRSLHKKTYKGFAVSADLNNYVGLGSVGGLKVNLGLVYNQQNFRNDAAQTPTLLATPNARIMNSENDPQTVNLYSTYDVLYRHVFKFTPSAKSAGVGNWFKAPMRKIAYTNSILTQDEIHALVLDPALYLVMPYGAATPNRVGGKGDLSINLLKNAIHASVGGKYLQEEKGGEAGTVSSPVTLPKTKFLEVGGGLSVDIGKLGNWWRYPFILSGGYTMSSAERTGAAADSFNVTADVGFANAGLYWTFWKKASVFGGLQLIQTKIETFKYDQLHWAGGLEYKVGEGGVLSASVGSIQYKDKDTDKYNFDQWQYDIFFTLHF